MHRLLTVRFLSLVPLKIHGERVFKPSSWEACPPWQSTCAWWLALAPEPMFLRLQIQGSSNDGPSDSVPATHMGKPGLNSWFLVLAWPRPRLLQALGGVNQWLGALCVSSCLSDKKKKCKKNNVKLMAFQNIHWISSTYKISWNYTPWLILQTLKKRKQQLSLPKYSKYNHNTWLHVKPTASYSKGISEELLVWGDRRSHRCALSGGTDIMPALCFSSGEKSSNGGRLVEHWILRTKPV